MTESQAIELAGPHTRDSLAADVRTLGVHRGLDVSDRVPQPGELRELFREQELRCGNVEEWAAPHLMALAGRYFRSDGSLVGAALCEGTELLLAVAFRDDLDREGVATALLRSSSGGEECWVPTADRDLEGALAACRWRPSTVDLQLRLGLPAAAGAPLPEGVGLVALAGPDEVSLHRAVHEFTCEAFGVDSPAEEFLERYVRDPAYDAGLWVLGQDSDGLCGAVIGRVLQLPDALVGKVASVAVAPRARGRGLAAALLAELCQRFASRGLLLAQLGSHEDNPSGATSMYRHLGWVQVSSKTRWQRGPSVRATLCRRPNRPG